MSDIDVVLDELGRYSTETLTEVTGHARQLASEATAFTAATGRDDSASAAAGLAEHVDALLGDIATAVDHDAGEVSATHEALLAVDDEISIQLGGLM